MSIKYMADAWKMVGITSPQKIVLLALCDNSNDRGECYPSITDIAKRCSLSVRTVNYAITKLEVFGALKSVKRSGRSSMYYLSDLSGFCEPNPCTSCTPATDAPLQQVQDTPARDAPPPLQQVQDTPARDAPITINEPREEKNKKYKTRVPRTKIFPSPAFLDGSIWDDFLTHRTAIKKPMNMAVYKRMVKRLEKFKSDGVDVVEAIDQSIRNGYPDVYPPRERSIKAGGVQRSGFSNTQYSEVI